MQLSSSKRVCETFPNPAVLPQIKPVHHVSIYIGQLQSIVPANDLVFIVDSEGVLTVIKALFRTIPLAMLTGKKNGNDEEQTVLPDIDGLESEPKIKPDLIESKPIRPTKELHMPMSPK